MLRIEYWNPEQYLTYKSAQDGGAIYTSEKQCLIGVGSPEFETLLNEAGAIANMLGVRELNYLVFDGCDLLDAGKIWGEV